MCFTTIQISSQVNAFLTETMIFPPALWFMLAAESEVFLEAYEHYQKRSFRNRYVLHSSKGPIAMSIPLCAGKNESMPIREVRISRDAAWQREHKRTLQTLYGRSPFYIYYSDELAELLDSDEEHLFNFNFRILEWILNQLRINIRLRQTESYAMSFLPENGDARGLLKPGKLAKQLLPPMPGLPARRADMSILDLLFQMGPEAGLWLMHQKQANQGKLLVDSL
jgi:hypothetical protein